MTAPLVRIEYRDRALIITLNRPERANALCESLLDALSAAGNQLQSYPDVRAVILTGAGDRAFCAGADLEERRQMSEVDVRRILNKYRSDLFWLDACSVPTVAALNGSALGGGLELALMCDLRVAVPHAMLGFPETSLGIVPGAGGTQRLPRLIGEARAKELILLCQRITAVQALGYGLVNRVCAPGTDVLKDTLDWLEPVLRGAPLATRAALQAIDAAHDSTLSQGLQIELDAYETCLTSQDRLEGLQAFAEKRPPNFRGR